MTFWKNELEEITQLNTSTQKKTKKKAKKMIVPRVRLRHCQSELVHPPTPL